LPDETVSWPFSHPASYLSTGLQLSEHNSTWPDKWLGFKPSGLTSIPAK